MKCRCGIEGIFCIVRDNTDYEFGPQWFFTSPEIDTFLAGALPAWDVNVIAMELEAFGIAGCDTFRKLSAPRRFPQCLTCYIVLACISRSRDHVAWSRKEVIRKLNLSYGIYFNSLDCSVALTLPCLAAAAGQRKAALPLTSHSKYTKEVTIHHGPELVGWPFAAKASFPTIPHDLGCLRILLSALQNNECYFQRISPEKLAETRMKYYEPLLTQTLQSAQEQGSTVAFEKPVPTIPNRKAKDFHLNPSVGSGDSEAKRCRMY